MLALSAMSFKTAVFNKRFIILSFNQECLSDEKRNLKCMMNFNV